VATASNKPPLARSAREFLTGVQLPAPPKHGPNPNKDYALLLHAMLWHAREVTEDAEFVKCSPSLRQLADLMFCSVRTVQRTLQKLISLRFVASQRRGDGLSSNFTIHKKPYSDTTTVVHSESTFRHDNSQVQSGQLRPSDTTTRISDTTTQGSDTTTVVHLRGKASGVDLQGRSPSGVKPQERSTEAKSKPDLRSTSVEDQTQQQKQNELFHSQECETLAKLLSENLGVASKDVWSVRSAIAMAGAIEEVSLPAASERVQIDALKAKADGKTLDFAYFQIWSAGVRDKCKAAIAWKRPRRTSKPEGDQQCRA
jgi:hypothetical protein